VAEPEAGPRIDVFPEAPDRWLWSYRAGDVELTSNHSFPDAAEALASARRAYPDVSGALISVRPEPRLPAHRDRPGPIALVVGLAAIALAWRNRRSARR
jgi:hypothetical protein